jgi:hypothetical protein
VHNTLTISFQLRLFPPCGDMWKHIFAHYSISTFTKLCTLCILTYFSRSWRSSFKNIHNVIQLRNYCLHLYQRFTLDTSDESLSHAMCFDLDLLFKVTQVRFCKYSQCDPTPLSLGISIRFSSWMHLKRICLLQPEFSPSPTIQFDCIYPSQA